MLPTPSGIAANGLLGDNRVDPIDSGLIVRPLTDADAARWDEFVLATPGGTFFHRFGWRRIFEEVFHLKAHFLLAERNGRIAGVLPLVHQKSLLFGNALIAAPFCVEGGTLAADAEALSALDSAAIALMEQTRASYIEFRSQKASRPGWATKKRSLCDVQPAHRC